MKTDKTVLLLIDIQKETNYDIPDIKDVVENTVKLIRCCRSKKIPVVYTRQINRQDCVALPFMEPLDEKGEPVFYNSATQNIEIFDEIKPEIEDVVIDKYRWSAFYETGLDPVLRSFGAKHLIIGGLVTDGCLMTTVFDAFFRDYRINLVKDICATTSPGAHMSSILIMSSWVNGIEIFDTSEIINKLDGRDYSSWKWTGQDSMKFDENNLLDVYKKLG